MTQIIPFPAREGIADNTVDWTGDTFGMAIFEAQTWSPDMTDEFVADITTAGAVEVGTRQTLTGNTIVADPSGYPTYQTDPISVPGVAANEPFDVGVLFQDNGSDATNLIIAIFGLGAQVGDGTNIDLEPDSDEGLIVF